MNQAQIPIDHSDLYSGQSRDRVAYPSLFRILVILVAVPILTNCGVDRVFSEDDMASIKGLIAAQSEAWNRGDLEGFMAGYVRLPELVFTSGGEIQRGWEGTLARYQRRYGGDRSSMGTLSLEIIELRPLGSDGAVVLGTWKLTGLARPAGGVFSLIFERRSEGWRIVHDHTSSWPEGVAPDSPPGE